MVIYQLLYVGDEGAYVQCLGYYASLDRARAAMAHEMDNDEDWDDHEDQMVIHEVPVIE